MKGLNIKNVSKSFGNVQILKDVSMFILPGKITGLVGPNGAGKTTLFHIISGSLKPDEGKIILNDEDITGLPPWQIAQKGIGKLFQDVRVFKSMTVIDNVVVTIQNQNIEQPLWGPLHPFSIDQLYEKHKEKALEWLKFVGLENEAYKLGGELSFGQQKLLAFARLMAGEFDVLLLDEPTAGINPNMTKKIEEFLYQIVEKYKKTIIIIEHNMSVIMNIADWVYFMHEGEIAFFGKPEHVLGAEKVRELYIGL